MITSTQYRLCSETNLNRLVGGSELTTASVAYNSSTHLWWKIRESGGRTYWETSADNVTWTTRASLTNPIAVTALRIVLFGVTYQAETNPGSANFDNLSYDSYPLLNKVSTTDAGFVNPDTGGDTHPFNSGDTFSIPFNQLYLVVLITGG